MTTIMPPSDDDLRAALRREPSSGLAWLVADAVADEIAQTPRQRTVPSIGAWGRPDDYAVGTWPRRVLICGGGRWPGRGDGSRGRARGLPASPPDAVAERLDRGRPAGGGRGRHRRRTTIGRWRARGAGHLAGLVAGRRPARVLVGSRGRSRVRPAGVRLAARDPGRAERLDRAPDHRRPAQGVGAERPDPVVGGRTAAPRRRARGRIAHGPRRRPGHGPLHAAGRPRYRHDRRVLVA